MKSICSSFFMAMVSFLFVHSAFADIVVIEFDLLNQDKKLHELVGRKVSFDEKNTEVHLLENLFEFDQVVEAVIYLELAKPNSKFVNIDDLRARLHLLFDWDETLTNAASGRFIDSKIKLQTDAASLFSSLEGRFLWGILTSRLKGFSADFVGEGFKQGEIHEIMLENVASILGKLNGFPKLPKILPQGYLGPQSLSYDAESPESCILLQRAGECHFQFAPNLIFGGARQVSRKGCALRRYVEATSKATEEQPHLVLFVDDDDMHMESVIEQFRNDKSVIVYLFKVKRSVPLEMR